MTKYQVGTVMVSNEKLGPGVTQGDWMIVTATEAATGNLYTLRALSRNTETNTVSEQTLDLLYHPLNPWRRKDS